MEPPQRLWIERSMHWFSEQFGERAALGDVAVPTPEFYPARYRAEPGQIHELFNKICGLMSVDATKIRLDLFDGTETAATARQLRARRVVGRYRRSRFGRDRIELDVSEAADPAYLTAVIAHELGHARLLGERRVTNRRRDHERLTDLVTVYLGAGVFNANAAVTYHKTAKGWSAAPLGELTESMLNGSGDERHLGYLTEREFGYGLACLARLRGESSPLWAQYLDPGVRTYLKQGLAYLAKTGSTKVEA